MSTVGTFTIIKNEARWIRAHLLSWLCFVDEMVFFDGNSTDGTLDIIKDVRKNHPFGKRITLVEDQDPKDLQDDYVRVFNACLRTLKTDYAIFAHPDMLLDDAGELGNLGEHLAYFTHLRSFGGDPGGPLYEIKGRAERWKNVYRLRNPDMGLHYFGHYGAWNEDCYFKQITGRTHEFFGDEMDRYPYKVGDSGIKLLHYSDVRPYARRVDRMVKCLINQGHSEEAARILARHHPRVTFETKDAFEFAPAEYHPLLLEQPLEVR